MRTITSSQPNRRSVVRLRPGSRHRWHTAARRLTTQLVTDGVVAGYIHEISARHRDHGSEDRPAAPPAVLTRPLAA